MKVNRNYSTDRRFALICRQAPYIQHAIPKDEFIVGRSPRCNLVIRDLHVSRQHAGLHWTDNKLCVIDLASRNGTFIEGQRISEGQLNHGQVIGFAGFEFIVEVQTAKSDDATDTPHRDSTITNGS